MSYDATRGVSPAAAGAVARKLDALGLPRCREILNRVFTDGWDVALRGDHVEVRVEPRGDDPDSDYCTRILGACERALDGYEVARVRKEVIMVGGVREAWVLEVRRDEWTRPHR